MSVIQLLVLDANRRPEVADIAERAQSEQTPYVAHDADLAVHTGFLPVTIGQRETGFEYYFEPIEEGQLPPEAIRFGTHQIIARTGSDMVEMFASMLFLRTAANLSGAAYVYPDDGIIVPPEGVDAYLSEQIDQVQKFI